MSEPVAGEEFDTYQARWEMVRKGDGTPIPASPHLMRSLLEYLANEPGSPLVEIEEGVYMIRTNISAEELDKDRPCIF